MTFLKSCPDQLRIGTVTTMTTAQRPCNFSLFCFLLSILPRCNKLNITDDFNQINHKGLHNTQKGYCAPPLDWWYMFNLDVCQKMNCKEHYSQCTKFLVEWCGFLKSINTVLTREIFHEAVLPSNDTAQSNICGTSKTVGGFHAEYVPPQND